MSRKEEEVERKGESIEERKEQKERWERARLWNKCTKYSYLWLVHLYK